MGIYSVMMQLFESPQVLLTIRYELTCDEYCDLLRSP